MVVRYGVMMVYYSTSLRCHYYATRPIGRVGLSITSIRGKERKEWMEEEEEAEEERSSL